MATIGHLIVGAAIGRAYGRGRLAMGALALAAASPDVDFFFFPSAAAAPYAHRGVTHSLSIAIVVAAIALVASGWRAAIAFGLAVASHGLIDSFSSRGAPVCLFWPITSARIETHLRVIPVVSFYFHFVRSFVIELAAFSPILLYALWPARKR